MAAIGGLMTYHQVTVTPTVAQVEAADTVLATITVPADAIILDVMLSTTDMDTGATLTLDVGDAAGPATPADDRFIAAFSGQAADVIHSGYTAGNLTENPIDYSTLSVTGATVDVECTVKAAATTGAAGTLTMGITYVRQ
jgi:hypothetical protein